MELKVEMIGREVIKPESPAPHDRLQLSLMDFNVPSGYISIIFFYNFADQAEKSMDVVSRKLKSSLSQTLSLFYPLAGKKEGVSIFCNDEGVVFTEARTDVHLSDFLGNLDINSLKVFLPTLAPGESPESWPLMNVQVTFFGSASGFAIGVGVSHNICDATSVSTFIKGWAASAKGDSSDELSSPQFAETAIYPPADISVPIPAFNDLRRKCITNRFVFESDKIKELKIAAESEVVPAPTRVEAITSLIWKCARNASHTNLVVPRASAMSQAVDLRPRIPSVLSPDAIGNISTVFFLKKDSGSKIEISETVAELRKEKEKLIEMMQENLDGCNNYTLGLKIMSGLASYMSERKPNIDEYYTSSWCRKRFYEVDFGWGRPAWVGPAHHAIQNDTMGTVLMDAKDGEGVEAWVSLQETDMIAFVCDQELLAYASLNPPVLI